MHHAGCLCFNQTNQKESLVRHRSSLLSEQSFLVQLNNLMQFTDLYWGFAAGVWEIGSEVIVIDRLLREFFGALIFWTTSWLPRLHGEFCLFGWFNGSSHREVRFFFPTNFLKVGCIHMYALVVCMYNYIDNIGQLFCILCIWAIQNIWP